MAADRPAGPPPDLPEKLARLATLAEQEGVDTLVLREPASLSWLIGARWHVPQTLDTSCFDVVVEFPRAGEPVLGVVASTIEAPRLRDTELAGLPARWEVPPWWEPRENRLPRGERVAADRPYAGSRRLGPALAAARRVLTSHQLEQLRGVCRDTAAAASAAAGRIGPRCAEYAAAGALADELLQRGLDPVVLMVAGDQRMAAHRHPLPTTAPVGRRVMLVCCARRHGLVASLTRIVAFDAAAAAGSAYSRLLGVEQAFLDATRPGRELGQVFAAGVAAYPAHGFAADEWHRHHQGGFTGWAPREYPAHTDSRDPVPENCAVAWNVSAAGWKVEDTCVVEPAGPRPLVHDGAWPTVEVGGRPRPDVLVNP